MVSLVVLQLERMGICGSATKGKGDSVDAKEPGREKPTEANSRNPSIPPDNRLQPNKAGTSTSPTNAVRRL